MKIYCMNCLKNKYIKRVELHVCHQNEMISVQKVA